MKGNYNTYRPLMEVINDALSDIGEGMHFQYRATRWGMKYAEELSFDFGTDIKTVLINFKPWQAIELPQDCIDWIAVGIQDGDDIKTFVREEHMSTLFTKGTNGVYQPNLHADYDPLAFVNSATDLSQLSCYSEYLVPFLNVTNIGGDPGKIFGQAVKDNGFGYVKENKNKDSNELIFKGVKIDTSKQVYLMYISNIWDPKAETPIHPMMAEYIVSGIVKEYHFQHKNSTDTQREMANQEFTRQYWKVIDRQWQLTTEDAMEYLKSGYKMTPKIG